MNILVVDDIPAIAEGFAGKFRRFSKEHFKVTADIEILGTYDEAVRRILNESKPKFDLLFTDIDLSGGDRPDKAGVSFARLVRSILPDVPIVGCSGRFDEDDLSEEDKALFDKWWSKSRLGENLEELSKETLSLAISYHQQKYQAKLSGAKSGSDNVSPAEGDFGLVTPITNKEFLDEGYVKSIIEPSGTNGLLDPFAVWVKNSPEGFELEVVGCGAIFSWGDTYEDAEAGLMEIINDMKQILHEPDESFSQSLLLAKRFVETVTGSRKRWKEAA